MTDRATQIKSAFESEGISIADWARARGYNIRTVYAVLRGELKARRGVGHQIAVDIGLKDKPRESKPATRRA